MITNWENNELLTKGEFRTVLFMPEALNDRLSGYDKASDCVESIYIYKESDSIRPQNTLL